MSTIDDLLERYADGKCDNAEKQRLEEWLDTHHNGDDEWLKKDKGEQQLWLDNLLADIDLAIDTKEQPAPIQAALKMHRPLSTFWQTSLIAASLFLVTGFAIWFFILHEPQQHHGVNTAGNNEILPGKNTATLVLSDGTNIPLSETKQGIRITKTGVSYTDGSPVNHTSLQRSSFSSALSTLKTPAGGQYQLVLTDGTKIWLNAATSITFSSGFADSKERRIALDGEAYLEVIKNKQQPFVVQTVGQQVRVLGTQFNINSYSDEPAIKTTLLEGAVSVILNPSQTVTLKPGEQAVLKEKQLKKTTVNTEEVIDWKEGDFILDDQDLPAIMREVSRWYNVKVVYEGNLQPMTFLGTISRSKKLSSLLELLESNGKVHFKIKDRTITVSP